MPRGLVAEAGCLSAPGGAPRPLSAPRPRMAGTGRVAGRARSVTSRLRVCMPSLGWADAEAAPSASPTSRWTRLHAASVVKSTAVASPGAVDPERRHYESHHGPAGRSRARSGPGRIGEGRDHADEGMRALGVQGRRTSIHAARLPRRDHQRGARTISTNRTKVLHAPPGADEGMAGHVAPVRLRPRRWNDPHSDGPSR